jgi:hypothetical protein
MNARHYVDAASQPSSRNGKASIRKPDRAHLPATVARNDKLVRDMSAKNPEPLALRFFRRTECRRVFQDALQHRKCSIIFKQRLQDVPVSRPDWHCHDATMLPPID